MHVSCHSGQSIWEIRDKLNSPFAIRIPVGGPLLSSGGGHEPQHLCPDFPDAVVLDGMIRAGTPAIQAFLAILTGAPDG